MIIANDSSTDIMYWAKPCIGLKVWNDLSHFNSNLYMYIIELVGQTEALEKGYLYQEVRDQ